MENRIGQMFERKNFKQGEDVIVDNIIFGVNTQVTGKIIGLSSRNLVDCYIVDVGKQFIDEYPFTAVVVQESYLYRAKKE
jgi:hypothetical protein